MMNREEFQTDTYRKPGAGSWSLSVDQAVRVIHLPTGVKYEACAERGQHRNKAVAMAGVLAQLCIVFVWPDGKWIFRYEYEELVDTQLSDDFAQVYVNGEWSDEQIFHFLRLKASGKAGQQAWLDYMESLC